MLGRDWGKNSENSSKMYHESKDFFGLRNHDRFSCAFTRLMLVLPSFCIGVGAKCLVSDIQPSSFKVKLASASVAVVVRQSETALARYPNYVAAVEHHLRAIHSAHITHAPVRLTGHNLTISTKGDASKASANADPRHLGDTMLVSCISTTGSLNFTLTSSSPSQWWFSLMFCSSPFNAYN